ncbi:MAG: hypothetical protein U5L72_08380 [Bacteroidales bacterium]|nr:hypothetical protein [Bacteroidales bacterium]
MTSGLKLTLNQKIIVLVQLLRVLPLRRSRGKQHRKLEFIITAAEGLNINPDDYQLTTSQFVMSSQSVKGTGIVTGTDN